MYRSNVLVLTYVMALEATACGATSRSSQDLPTASDSGSVNGTTTSTGNPSAGTTGVSVGGSGNTGGSGGASTELLRACPDAGLLRCGSRLIATFSEGGAGGSSTCELDVDAASATQPLVAVDCELVPRFEAAQDGSDVENWTWESDSATLTFKGDWCERLQDGYERIDLFQTFDIPC